MTSFLESGETGDFVKAFLSGEDPRASAHLLRSTMALMYTTQESPATRPRTPNGRRPSLIRRGYPVLYPGGTGISHAQDDEGRAGCQSSGG